MHKRICVLGLGHVGLPTACLLANAGYSVQGVDIDEGLVLDLQSGLAKIAEPGLEGLLVQALRKRTLTISKEPAPADIYIIAVPTPSNEVKQPDLSCINAGIAAIERQLQPKNMVLIESTCPVGVTDSLATRLRRTCSDVYVAYCPERMFPGNAFVELKSNDRIIGGVDEASAAEAKLFYESFVTGEISLTDARTAEAVKLVENAYRDVNIAYSNELSMIADRLNLDVNKVIQLANKHPRVDILTPGPGVGGHCLPIDPWFLAKAAPDLSKLIQAAREVNEKKVDWVVDRVRAVIREKQAKVIACFGLTYKPNVSDVRGSPALRVVDALKEEVEVLTVDSYVSSTHTIQQALDRAEIFVGLVAHREFKEIPNEEIADKIFLDFTGDLV